MWTHSESITKSWVHNTTKHYTKINYSTIVYCMVSYHVITSHQRILHEMTFRYVFKILSHFISGSMLYSVWISQKTTHHPCHSWNINAWREWNTVMHQVNFRSTSFPFPKCRWPSGITTLAKGFAVGAEKFAAALHTSSSFRIPVVVLNRVLFNIAREQVTDIF